jgi:hypothetical protein
LLNLQQLIDAQKRGEAQLTNLTDEEKTVIQAYCYAAAGGLLQAGVQNKAQFDEIVMNAFRNGIALGCQVEITNRAINRRH